MANSTKTLICSWTKSITDSIWSIGVQCANIYVVSVSPNDTGEKWNEICTILWVNAWYLQSFLHSVSIDLCWAHTIYLKKNAPQICTHSLSFTLSLASFLLKFCSQFFLPFLPPFHSLLPKSERVLFTNYWTWFFFNKIEVYLSSKLI